MAGCTNLKLIKLKEMVVT